MKIKGFFICAFIIIQFGLFGQDRFDLILAPKTLPSYGANSRFIGSLNGDFAMLIKNRADSILLFYQVENNYNFAMIFSKKDDKKNVTAYFQYNPPNNIVSKTLIKNDTLNNIDIKSIFKIFLNDEIRQLDSSIMFPNLTPVYCQAYIGRKRMIKSGYLGLINEKMPLYFLNAYIRERNLFIDQELVKYNIPKMKF